MQPLIGTLLAILIAIAAWRAGSLSASGALGATITGGLIFGLGGLPWAILLLTFFISSSALSRAFSQRKAGLAEKFSKGNRRDWGQVLANGGLGALLVVVYSMTQSDWLWLAYAGAMAAVNADTWSTELGVLSPIQPFMITSGRRVERGTSGGVSLIGTLAAMGGAGLVGAMAVLFKPAPNGLATLGIIALAGYVGSFYDSFLGATVQAIYWCPTCQKETERHPLHTCGAQTSLVRGYAWINNDMVNFACSLMGAILASAAWFFPT
ncbi:MAG: hypothetical protein A2136_05600 [Chloroflexi bacterium RBG_16_54_11]|nr:MAG: hypothetical protein A2136_05600 [Chloroflexi bacterium RBG_16_54_11]